jgi:hypothetical protein
MSPHPRSGRRGTLELVHAAGEDVAAAREAGRSGHRRPVHLGAGLEDVRPADHRQRVRGLEALIRRAVEQEEERPPEAERAIDAAREVADRRVRQIGPSAAAAALAPYLRRPRSAGRPEHAVDLPDDRMAAVLLDAVRGGGHRRRRCR